ncbi:hypothetical protein ACK6EA_09450 [Riemerella anatipestifer]
MGISLGGLISQIASIKFADRVNSLTLMSSGPWETQTQLYLKWTRVF